MAIIGFLFCLLGLAIVAFCTSRPLTLKVPIMAWGFGVLLVGILCILTAINWT